MPGRVEGKVAFITGAGRGQGRSHAIRLAEEGADIIAVDVLEDYPTVRYAMSGRADLEETVRAVQALGRRIVAAKADVRDAAALRAALDAGVAELGRLDIVCANAGIYTVQGMPFLAPYVATKHAVVGICRSLANELAGHHIPGQHGAPGRRRYPDGRRPGNPRTVPQRKPRAGRHLHQQPARRGARPARRQQRRAVARLRGSLLRHWHRPDRRRR